MACRVYRVYRVLASRDFKAHYGVYRVCKV